MQTHNWVSSLEEWRSQRWVVREICCFVFTKNSVFKTTLLKKQTNKLPRLWAKGPAIAAFPPTFPFFWEHDYASHICWSWQICQGCRHQGLQLFLNKTWFENKIWDWTGIYQLRLSKHRDHQSEPQPGIQVQFDLCRDVEQRPQTPWAQRSPCLCVDWSWPLIHPSHLTMEWEWLLKSRQGTRKTISNWAVMWTLTSLGPRSGPLAMRAGWLGTRCILRPWSPEWSRATSKLATRWMNSNFILMWTMGQSLVTPFTRRWTRRWRLLSISRKH